MKEADRGTNPTEAASAQKKLRERVATAMREGKTIYVDHPQPWQKVGQGDNLIIGWAVNYVLDLVRQQEGVPQEPRLLIPPGGEIISKSDGIDLYAEIGQLPSEAIQIHSAGIAASQLELFSSALGVELPSGYDQLVPQPVPVLETALANFDQARVREIGDTLRLETVGRKRLSIVQAGSKSQKRLTDEQVAELVQQARRIDPTAHITVITDSDISEVPGKRLYKTWALGKGPNKVVAGRDINVISAELYASDHVFTTDTFLSWLAAGSISLRADRNGRINPGDITVLYTVADATFWHISGAEAIESEAYEHWERVRQVIEGHKPPEYQRKPNAIFSNDYSKYMYWKYDRGTPLKVPKNPMNSEYEEGIGMDRNDFYSARNTDRIHRVDIAKLKAKMQQVLTR